MGVADGQERPLDPDREVDGRPGGELLDVHVPAVLPGRHGAVAAGLVERGPEDPGKRRERHGHARARVGAHPRERAVLEVPDLEERVREVGLRQEPAARADVGPAERGRRPDI